MTNSQEEPSWLAEMSPHERKTNVRSYERTEYDYLTILSERPSASFTEYDNLNVLFDMNKRGLIRWRDGVVSKHTGMFTALYPELTELGKQAMAKIKTAGG